MLWFSNLRVVRLSKHPRRCFLELLRKAGFHGAGRLLGGGVTWHNPRSFLSGEKESRLVRIKLGILADSLRQMESQAETNGFL